MDISHEKQEIYTLMQQIMKERQQLSKQYFELKEQLDCINKNQKEYSEVKKITKKNPKQQQKELIELTKYFLDKKETNNSIPYSKIALQISHILKKSCVPLSNKQIYIKLTEEFDISLSYSNLSNNILPRINSDSSINVNKVTRGFWQYKLNN